MDQILEKALELISNNYNVIKNDWVYVLCAALLSAGIVFSVLKFFYKESLDKAIQLKTLIKEENEILGKNVDKQSKILKDKEDLIKNSNNEINKLYADYEKVQNELDRTKRETQDIVGIFKKLQKLHKAETLFDDMINLQSKINESQLLIMISDLNSISIVKNYILEQLFKGNSESTDRYKVYFEKALSLEKIITDNMDFVEGNEKNVFVESYDNASNEIKKLVDEFIEMEEKYCNIQEEIL